VASEAEVRLDKKIKSLQLQINGLMGALNLRGKNNYPSSRFYAQKVEDKSIGSYLKLDQTVPQTVFNGLPIFQDGLTVGPPGFIKIEGNVYIGFDDPTADLLIEQYCDGSNAYILRSDNSDYSQFCYGINTNLGYAYIQSTHDGTGIVLPLTFWIHGDRMVDINSTGMGIGTNTPDTLLHLRKTNATTVIRLERDQTAISSSDILGRLEIETKDTTDPGVCAKIEALSYGTSCETGWRFSCGTPSVLTEVMQLDPYGFVGIGTPWPDSPATLLHIKHATAPYFRLTRNDTTVTVDEIIGKIEFETKDATSAGVAAFIQGIAEGSSGEVGLDFGTGVGSGGATKMRLDHHGSLAMGSTTPDVSALVDITSTTKGFLPPRMTGLQVEAISTPATGLMVYATNAGVGDVTAAGWWGYNGANWVQLG
jgi:hypothetical protein